jgi:hypothetical protein
MMALSVNARDACYMRLDHPPGDVVSRSRPLKRTDAHCPKRGAPDFCALTLEPTWEARAPKPALHFLVRDGVPIIARVLSSEVSEA